VTQEARNRKLSPPQGGHKPPTEAALGPDVRVPLVALAEEICRRYRAEFPDEKERYGDAGIAWCVHDNQHLLNWGAGEVSGLYTMRSQVAWLAAVLQARDFPVDRLARDLDIAAEVVLDSVTGDHGSRLAVVLTEAAAFVRTLVEAGGEQNAHG
jgi:hypothetical protein